MELWLQLWLATEMHTAAGTAHAGIIFLVSTRLVCYNRGSASAQV